MNLTFTLKEEIFLLNKYKLSPNELFIIRLLLIAQDENDSSYLMEFAKIPESDRGDLRSVLVSLQNKGVLLKSYKIPSKGQPLVIEDVEFNQNFLKNIYKASFTLGSELFEHYPQFTNINGNMVAIRSVSKKFDTLEDAFSAYGRAIRWNPELHNEIISLIDWAKNNTSFINCTLANFIVDRKWQDIKALKDGELTNVNFDTVRML